MKPTTPKTELSSFTQLRRAISGGSLKRFVPLGLMLLLMLSARPASSGDSSATGSVSCWTAESAGAANGRGPFSLGYRFVVTNQLQLTHLGRVDYNGAGLAVPALARVYNWDTGAAVADVTIPAGLSGRETNGLLAVHYAALTNAITLYPGTNYLVAVEVTVGDFGYAVKATMADGVQWIEGRASASPTLPATADRKLYSILNVRDAKCYLGPSFKFAAPAIKNTAGQH